MHFHLSISSISNYFILRIYSDIVIKKLGMKDESFIAFFKYLINYEY